MKLAVLVLGLFSMINCSVNSPKSTADQTAKFNQFVDKVFDENLQLAPEEMAFFGKKERYGELNDYSESFEVLMLERSKTHLKQLYDYNRESLDPQARITYDVFQKALQDRIDDYKWKDYNYAITQQAGVHTDLPTFMMTIHKIENEQDLKDYISRLKGFPKAFADVGHALHRSEKLGVIQPKFVFPYVYKTAENMTTGRPFDPKAKKDSPLYEDFKRRMKALKLKDVKQQQGYMAQVEDALKTSVKPAYDQLVGVLKTMETRATADDGAWKFPKGDEYYARRLQRYTTTTLSPEEVHQLGVQNVERLRQGMVAIKEKLKIKGDLPQFFATVRKDPKQYFPDTEAGRKGYLKMAQGYLDGVNKQVPTYFRTIPKTGMEIRPVEAFREASAGKAFYYPPADDGSRSGIYYVNLHSMKDVPKFESEALLYHEGIPGHHFQIALAIEMKDLPKLRRYNHVGAYVEGWGLYAERLGKEMGGYKTEYTELGRLSMEMMRACRLVVDSGIHFKKWTREQAIDYLAQNMPVNRGMQVEQIERYIVWPGQATGYMVGMLKIYDLREKAKAALGTKFDIRDFHDVVLKNGGLPLDILEQQVMAYIESKKS